MTDIMIMLDKSDLSDGIREIRQFQHKYTGETSFFLFVNGICNGKIVDLIGDKSLDEATHAFVIKFCKKLMKQAGPQLFALHCGSNNN